MKVILFIVLWKYISGRNWLHLIIIECKSIAHTWIIENMRLEFRSLRLNDGKITSLWQNRSGFFPEINRLKFTNFSQKGKVYVKNWIKTKSFIIPSHTIISRLAEYMSSSCLGILTGGTREIQGLLGFTVQDGWPLITSKNVKKYFHDAPKWLKL